MGLDSGDNGLQFLGADALAIILAVLPPLQQEVRALGNGLATAFELISLLAQVATDHPVDAGHFFEDLGAFLLEGGRDHSLGLYCIYHIQHFGRKSSKPCFFLTQATTSSCPPCRPRTRTATNANRGNKREGTDPAINREDN